MNMQKSIVLSFCAIVLTALSAMSQTGRQPLDSINEYGTRWGWDNGTIVVDTPQREAGQRSVLGLALPPMESVRVGFVGLGMRGPGAVKRFTHIPGVEIKALCDYEKERAEKCQQYLMDASMPEADIYYGENGYKELCKRKDIDLIYIAVDWLHHAPIAIYALENNKNVATEVPAAMTLQECWDLVNLAEKKQKHCIILENCCYDWFEMNTLNMAQHGVFGEIIRAQGAYIHDLSPYWKHYWKNGKNDRLGWRLDYNMRHRGDVYATHGLGPVAQAMDIHRGDRMETLVAMDTRSFNGRKLVEEAADSVCNSFRNGDHTTTLIRTANGKMIEIQHNVMTPQPYNRLYQLTGTKGLANKYPVKGYALGKEQLTESGVEVNIEDLSAHSFLKKKEANALTKKYRHPVLKQFGELAKVVGGHGGMDFIMDSRLVYCLQNGLPLDMDVYDLAEWCSLAELGSLSMDHNSAPVTMPDFTRGDWRKIKGYRHAFATPEQEAISLKKANEFTERLKKKASRK